MTQRTQNRAGTKPQTKDALRSASFDAADVASRRAREYVAATRKALDEAREAFEAALEQSDVEPLAYAEACNKLRLAHHEHKAAERAMHVAIELRECALTCELLYKP